MSLWKVVLVLVVAAGAALAYWAFNHWSDPKPSAQGIVSIHDQAARLLSKPVENSSKQAAGRLLGDLNSIIGRLPLETRTHCLAVGDAVRASLQAYLGSPAGAQIVLPSDTSLNECRDQAAAES